MWSALSAASADTSSRGSGQRALARAGGNPRRAGAHEIDCDQASFVFEEAR
jgi:hypothetical protein